MGMSTSLTYNWGREGVKLAPVLLIWEGLVLVSCGLSLLSWAVGLQAVILRHRGSQRGVRPLNRVSYSTDTTQGPCGLQLHKFATPKQAQGHSGDVSEKHHANLHANINYYKYTKYIYMYKYIYIYIYIEIYIYTSIEQGRGGLDTSDGAPSL